MRHSLILAIFLALTLVLPPVAKAENSKPFRRALILAGTGLNVPLSLGFVDGVSAAGKAPDVVIGVWVA